MYDCVFDVSSMVVNEQRYGKEKYNELNTRDNYYHYSLTSHKNVLLIHIKMWNHSQIYHIILVDISLSTASISFSVWI